ncbi:hypothetical protein [Polyangium mundeleinium]|uniref:Uncharacterized protein n=1 Tax=Polyangium mundeleinium TaxID=2995306 RepID=A0ABT5F095_9BACT|nr:hypothetical protein [Polyangium mundeleinium]MDC0747503.1 hypothetical protein [Polyangium mundeleinium]
MRRRVFAWCLLLILFILCAPSVARALTFRVCVKPPNVPPGVNQWAYDLGAATVWTTKSHVEFAQKAQGHAVYIYDPYVAPESVRLLPIPYNKLKCPPPPRPEPAKAKEEKKAPPEEKKEAAPAKASEGSKAPPVQKDEQANVIPFGAKKRPERPPEKPRASPPPPQGVLSNEPLLPSTSTLPKRDEVHPPKCVDEQCTMVDRGGALPELQHRQGRPLVSAVPCEQTKDGCTGKGDGAGKNKALTPIERMVRELTIASAMLNGEFHHDLARKDGKRFGIIGGDNEDGVDSAVVQAAAAITQVASAVLVGQAEKFAKKLEEACAKKAPLILQGAEELSKETAELLAKQYGVDIAAALEQNGAIGAYEVMSQFTKNLGGSYQAHHLLEKAMAGRWGLTKEFDKIPSVILTEANHKKITKRLKELTPNVRDVKELWKHYQDAYVDDPHWIEAIKPFFVK